MKSWGVILFLVAAMSFVAGYYWSESNSLIRNGGTVTEISRDTVYITHTVRDTVIPRFTVTPRYRAWMTGHPTNTVKSIVDDVNDSLSTYKELFPALEYDSVYTASMDTVVADSALRLSVSFHSPIPLHPSALFTFQADLRQREVTIVKMIEPAWMTDHPQTIWDRIGFGISAGYGYMPAAEKGGLNVTLGIFYRIW